MARHRGKAKTNIQKEARHDGKELRRTGGSKRQGTTAKRKSQREARQKQGTKARHEGRAAWPGEGGRRQGGFVLVSPTLAQWLVRRRASSCAKLLSNGPGVSCTSSPLLFKLDRLVRTWLIDQAKTEVRGCTATSTPWFRSLCL